MATRFKESFLLSARNRQVSFTVTLLQTTCVSYTSSLSITTFALHVKETSGNPVLPLLRDDIMSSEPAAKEQEGIFVILVSK